MATRRNTGTSTIFDDTYRTLTQKLPRLSYEKDLAEIANSPEQAAKLLTEYQKINVMLQKVFPLEENADAFLILCQLIKKISNYTLRREQTLREGVNDTMGGKILDLYVDRIERRGKREGRVEGKAEGQWAERLASIKNVMASTSWNAEKAMDILRIPQGERAALLAAL